MKALHNDRLIPKDQTKVQLDTVAFKYAAMVFEGIRAYWNETEEQLFVFRLGDHARRLENSVRIMRMDTRLTAEDYSSAVLRVLEANAIRQDAHIRQMVYVDGPGEMFGTARQPLGGRHSQGTVVFRRRGRHSRLRQLLAAYQ